ncbi:MAG: hypothetical protein ABI832_12340 [bacterium]
MTRDERRVVEGFKLPSTAPITDNELDWIDMLRSIVGDAVPPPSLAAVQALRMALGCR